MQQQPQIESLKREFIMQPANKNAQGYTPDQRSAITTWRRRLASLVGFRAYIIFIVGTRKPLSQLAEFQMPFYNYFRFKIKAKRFQKFVRGSQNDNLQNSNNWNRIT